jgi:hypothetical protein
VAPVRTWGRDIAPLARKLAGAALAVAIAWGGCGRPVAPGAKRVLEREETVEGIPVRLRSELAPSRGTLGDPLTWKLSAQLGAGMKPESLRVAAAPAGLDLEGPSLRAANGRPGAGTFSREFRVRGFDLGGIPLPAASIAVRAGARRDTLEFPRDTVFVDSLTPAASGSIRPDRGPLEPALRPIDYAIAGIAAVAVLAAALLLVRALLRSRRKQASVPVEPPVPPEVILRAALADLARDMGSVSRDVFYDRLSLALRVYAGAVTGAPALDYTTTELDRDLARRPGVVPDGRRRLVETLRRADLAKFAKYQDAESDARSILGSAGGIPGTLLSTPSPAPPDEHASPASDRVPSSTRGG